MNLKHAQHGFSLVETLVAIGILIIAVTAPLTIVVRSTQGSQFSSEQVVATFLAQEGLELAQKLRDDAFLAYFDEVLNSPPPGTTPWATTFDTGGAYSQCFSSQGCGLYIDNVGPSNDGQAQVTSDSCGGNTCRLYRHTGGSPQIRSQFTHDSTGQKEETKYTRSVRFEYLPMSNVPGSEPNPEVRVVSTVTWRTGTLLASQRVVTQTSLLNLYDLP